MTDRPVPHGTPTGYSRHKCRCDACKAAEMARQRDYRARLKAGIHIKTGPSAMPVIVRGVVYPSSVAAARALGISSTTIATHLHRHGHADFAGLGTKSPIWNKVPRRKSPVTLYGRDFPTITAAADYMGVGRQWLWKALRKGKPADAGDRILAALMRAEERERRAA